MKRFYVLLLCLLTLSMVSAQTRVLHGLVLDAKTREPLVGASVVQEGTTTGTVTDLDGRYEITVKPGSQLQISYIGYKTQDVTAKNDLQVLLQEETSMLDEVMVVAFGTTTKRSYTGSASVVSSDDLVRRQSSNITSSLAGQVAGVQGLSTSGQPGEVSEIRIRGIGSLNSSNAPLYVIDGVPATTEAVAALSNNDIASVTVQKDAASNALYGARGANGVILITTKRGTSQKAHISFDAKWGTNRRGVPNYDVMTSPAMYYETFYQALYNGGLSMAQKGLSINPEQYAQEQLVSGENGLGYQVYTVPSGQYLVGSNGKLNPNATLGYVNPYGYTLTPDDWYKELFQNNNLRQEYNLSISGSDKNFNYFTSASYLDDKGIIENSGYQRFTARTNLEYNARKWLKLTTNMNYAHAQQNYPSEDSYGNTDSGNLFYITDYIAPIYPLYIRDAQGNIMRDANGYTMYDYGDATVNGATRGNYMVQSNPASAIALDKEKYIKDLFNGKWMVVAEPYKGLKLNANVGVDYAGIRHQQLVNPYYGQYASSGGYTSVNATRDLTVNQQYLVTYNNKFAQKHLVDLLAGYENYNYTYNYLYGTAQKVFNADVAEVGNAILSPSTTSYTDRYRTQSILLQAKYAYADRYFLSASYNRNASSRFAKGHQWGNFWSVGAAWDIRGEQWMQSATWLDQLKLRASYGAQGNDNLLTQNGDVNYYPYTDQYTLSENNGAFATTMSYKGNQDLTWETSYNLTIGTDLAFLDERLSATIEFWRRRTKDQLYYKPVPSSLGYSYLPINMGSVANTGLDLELHGDAIRTKHVTWSLYANLTYYKNKILSISSDLGGQWIEGQRIYREGESMYQLYIPQYAGVDPTDGKALWYMDETQDDGSVVKTTTREYSEATKYATGDILPKVYGGFGTRLEAYGVDFDIAFNYQVGGRILDGGYMRLMHSGSSDDAGTNWHMDILNAWTPENTDTDIPAVNSYQENENAVSDRFLISSNYISLQNITLGYTLPSQWIHKLHIDRLRIYAVADNVALWSKRKGLDPRQSYTSVNGTNYAAMRTISGGFTIEF